MRKIIANLATSYDKLIEGPNGELDWFSREPGMDFADILNDILADKDIILYGRTSYEKWGWYHPGDSEGEKVKAAYDTMHSKQKYVLSSTQTGDGTKAIFLNTGIREKLQALKQEAGNNIWLYGGAKTITTVLNLGLIDEFRLAVHPIILGKGKPLFHGIEQRHPLQLIEVRPYPSGIVLETYAVKR